MYRKLTFVLILLLVSNGFVGVLNGNTIGTDEKIVEESEDGNPVLSYTLRGPIRIDGNGDFISANGVSNPGAAGTEVDPYIIEGWEINGTDEGCCIYIGNTTAHFIVRDCYLYNASGNPGTYWMNSGIYLYSVNNGTLDNNTLVKNELYGLYMDSSDNNVLKNNTAWNNTSMFFGGPGFYIKYSEFNVLEGNNVSENFNGIHLYYSNHTELHHNNASHNKYGITLTVSEHNLLTNNTASYNTWDGDSYGYDLEQSGNNTLIDNYASSNLMGAVFLDRSFNNTLSGNEMVSNGIFIADENIGHWDSHQIDDTNTVNAKPVYYWKNRSGGNVPAGAGQVIIVNSTGVNVEDQILDDGTVGIMLGFSDNNSFSDNVVSHNIQNGIHIRYSNNNTFNNNTLENNGYIGGYSGVYMESETNGNLLYHNNFINNTWGATDHGNNHWNRSYPIGGNYWDDYSGVDNNQGPNQDIAGSDGIGDTNYSVTQGVGVDEYPLMEPTGMDSVPPKVNSTIPLNASNDVVRSQNVIVVYNESMNTLATPTITQKAGTSVSYTFAGWSTTNVTDDTATWTHGDWEFNETITLNVTGGEDLWDNVQEPYEWSFTTAPDTYPPHVTSSSPQGVGVTIGSDIVITFNETMDEASVESAISVVPSISYTPSWNAASTTITLNPDSDLDYNTTYNVTVDGSTATDEEGNYLDGDQDGTAGGDYTWEFTTEEIDTEKPTSTVDPITDYWQTSFPITITATASDSGGSGLSNVTLWYRYSDDNSTWGSWTEYELDANAPWEWFFDFPDNDGFYEFYSIAYDNDGNEEESKTIAETNCGYDETDPSLTIDDPSDGQTIGSDSSPVSWTSSDDTSGISHHMVALDSGDWIDVGTSDNYEFTSVSDGTHDIYVRAVDNAGNTVSESITVSVDTTPDDSTPPSITILSPDEGEVLGTSDVTIEWTGDDSGSGIDHYEIKYDDNQWTGLGTDTSDISNLLDGEHTVHVRAVDNAGNHKETQVNFTIDTQDPLIEITSPTQDEVIEEDSVTVQWDASDNTTDFTTVIRIDGGNWTNTTSGSYLFTELNNGEHTVEVRVTDEAGNQNTDSVTFTVDVQDDEEEQERGFPWYLMLLPVVIVLLLLVIFFARKRSEKEERPPEEFEEPEEPLNEEEQFGGEEPLDEPIEDEEL